MRKSAILLILLSLSFSACKTGSKVFSTSDYEYKYEVAKCNFVEGKYNEASALLEELITIFKGSAKAEESLYLLGMCYYNAQDYLTASHYFSTYYKTYPRGIYNESARFYSGKSLFKDTPEARLDQSSTYSAIQELQTFLEFYPQSKYKQQALDIIYEMHDKLVEKEYYSALMYYNLGTYMGNNYLACVITAQNALKDFPYAKLREELSILILRSKYQMAVKSIEEKMIDRYRDTVDEYYAFKNEYPESKYLKEAEKYYHEALKVVKE